MRLIDADALIADCQLAQKQADRDGREYANAFYSGGGEISTEWWCVEDMIENAPTIEPERKRGNWEVIEAESWKGGAYARCSECGTGFAFGAFFEPDEFKFCPECGAEMEVNDDHND